MGSSSLRSSDNPDDMGDPSRKASFRFGVGLCVVYAVLGWSLLANQSTPFPLGVEDQTRILAALGKAPSSAESGWLTALVDPALARMTPSDPYWLLIGFRRTAAVASLVGLCVWAWRMEGWLFGVWVGILSIGFLPLRIASTTLAPQVICVVLLVWGGLLTLGRPWSKTGTAEQFGGGILLGGACFSAPWGFLFGGSVPLHALYSKSFRRGLERPFWIGFGLGLLPGVFWLVFSGAKMAEAFGLRPETLSVVKAEQLLGWAFSAFGWIFLCLVLLGVYSVKSRPRGEQRGALDLTWPTIPALLFGYADPLRGSLAFAGTALLAAHGVRWCGYLFVNKTERKWLSSFLALLVGYGTFFGAFPDIRERQAHSREVKDLAELLLARVPRGSAIALFRLNPVAEYLAELNPDKSWKIVRKAQFPEEPRIRWSSFWNGQIGEGNLLWVDRKRMSEPGEGMGEGYWNKFLRAYRPRNVYEQGQVELWQFSGEPQTR